MNYLICIKQVPDTTTRFQLAEDKRNVDLSYVKWIINPYDEFAIEMALRLAEKDKEQGETSQLEVLAVGPERSKEALRTALSMGIHKAIHLKTDKYLDSLAAAQVIHHFLKNKKETVDVILCGKHSIDWGLSATGPMLASLLKWPSVSPVYQVDRQNNVFTIHRPIEGGNVEILYVEKPLVMCVTKGEHEPRYPSLPEIMRAKTKLLETLDVTENVQNYFSIESLEFPKERSPVQMIEGKAEEQARKLVEILRNKEGIIP